MPFWNNRAISGQPTLPYRDNEVMQGSDCWMELTFIDRTGALSIPTSVTYQIDNITNNISILGPTTPSASLASAMEILIPASLNNLSYVTAGSQLNQVKVTAVLADGSTVTQIFPYYLIAIATVGGT